MVPSLPQSMRETIARLKCLSSDDCLRAAYDELTMRFTGGRLRTITRFPDLLRRHPEQWWDRGGFLHCTHFNQLYRRLLLESGHFSPEQIETRWTLLWYVSPHQYVRVHCRNGTTCTIDPWGACIGVPFGEYAHGFQRNHRSPHS